MREFGLSVVYVAFLGITAQIIGVRLPRRWFDAGKFPYAAFAFETDGRIYKALRVRRWKTLVPDMSRISKPMIPKRINAGAVTSEDIDALVKETCVAEFVHISLSFLSLAILSFWKNQYGVLFVILYILVGNVPFIIIQRYNRPQLIRVSGKLKRRECKRLHEGTGPVM